MKVKVNKVGNRNRISAKVYCKCECMRACVCFCICLPHKRSHVSLCVCVKRHESTHFVRATEKAHLDQNCSKMPRCGDITNEKGSPRVLLL